MSYLIQSDKPLFPKILWNRPISKITGPSLLIIGGHSNGFNQIQLFFQAITISGISKCQIILPISLSKYINQDNDLYLFVPSNKSGSIAKSALGLILPIIQNNSAVALGNDLSHNSETIMLVKSLLLNHLKNKPIIIWGEALNIVIEQCLNILQKEKILVIIEQNQLNILLKKLCITQTAKSNNINNKILIINQLRKNIKADLILSGPELIVSTNNYISVTKLSGSININLVSGIAAAFWLLNSSDNFQGLTTASYITCSILKKGNIVSNNLLLDKLKNYFTSI